MRRRLRALRAPLTAMIVALVLLPAPPSWSAEGDDNCGGAVVNWCSTDVQCQFFQSAPRVRAFPALSLVGHQACWGPHYANQNELRVAAQERFTIITKRFVTWPVECDVCLPDKVDYRWRTIKLTEWHESFRSSNVVRLAVACANSRRTVWRTAVYGRALTDVGSWARGHSYSRAVTVGCFAPRVR